MYRRLLRKAVVSFLAHEVGEAGPSHGSLAGQMAGKVKGEEETFMKQWGREDGEGRVWSCGWFPQRFSWVVAGVPHAPLNSLSLPDFSRCGAPCLCWPILLPVDPGATGQAEPG